MMKNSNVEWIGIIPENWKIGKLKNIKDKIPYAIVDGPFGSAISTDDYLDSGIPLIRIVNIRQPGLTTEQIRYISEELANTIQRSSIRIGDIIFAKTGATVGKCAINDKFEKAIMSSSCVKISIAKNYYNKYYYYLFITNEFNSTLRLSCNGTTRDTINLQPFSNIECCIPPYEEQIKIADLLDKKCEKIDRLIEIQQQEIEKLKEYKTSVITQAVTKGLDPNVPMKDSGIEWIGKIPQDWEVSKIKYAVDKNIENSFIDGDWIESQDITTEGIRYYTTGNVGEGFFKSQGESYISENTFKRLNCKYAYGGDLVISRLNEPYGRSCILPDDITECVLAVDIVICRLNSNFSKYFINYITQCPNYQKAVGDMARGTAMKRISRTNLSNIYITQPSIKKQNEIIIYLDEICNKVNKTIDFKQKTIEKLQEYKKSMIYEYVTGKRRVI